MQELDLPAEKVNVHGGVCALGHPIGASGVRILLICCLTQSRKKRFAVAVMCIGGGEATVIAIQVLN